MNLSFNFRHEFMGISLIQIKLVGSMSQFLEPHFCTKRFFFSEYIEIAQFQLQNLSP